MPVDGDDTLKQTNEIGMAIPTLTPLELTGKTLTADALLTQRALAEFLIARDAHYVFTVKANQPILYADVRLAFSARGAPDFSEPPTLAHGRIEQRCIWTTTRLNGYLRFPGVGQAFLIERRVTEKKTGITRLEHVYGLTSHTPASADSARVLRFNRDHWTIENSCHYCLDWNWDEDRCPIRTGHGPENMTALRRFAIGLIKANSNDTVAATIQRLARNTRLVFDYLRLTENSKPRPAKTHPASG